jgi:hypothetical protein
LGQESAGRSFEADNTYKQIISLGVKNYPLVDWHVHFKPGLGLKEAMERSRRDGIYYGVSANCGRKSQYNTDAQVRGFLDSVKGENAFVGMQAEGGDWQKVFSRDTCAAFDYIFNDGMIWTDDSGRWTRLYRPEDLGPITNAEKFMDEHAEARMRRVVDAAARHRVAIELSDRFRMPGEKFILMAKAAGCKFVLGTGNSGAEDLRRSEFGLEMIDKCKLGWQDFYAPGTPKRLS